MKHLKFYKSVLLSIKFHRSIRVLKMNRYYQNLCCEENRIDKGKDIKVSTLYVPGRHGGNIYQIVKPDVDLNYIQNNLKVIDESCRARRIELDLQLLLNTFKKWTAEQSKYQKIVKEVHELQAEEKRLNSLNLKTEAEEIKKHIDSNLDLLKSSKESVYDIEDILMPLIQKIPNNVDPDTPDKDPLVKVYLEHDMLGARSCSHIEIGNTLSLLEFLSSNPYIYYLKGSFAELELVAQEYFSKKLQEAEFALLSCVDFCKSFIVEAAGLDPHSLDQCIPLKGGKGVGQKYNLVGGASFESFLVYLTNMNTASVTLPAKYFCIGRHYEAGYRNNSKPSLFSVVQSSRVHGVVLSLPSHENLEFTTLLDLLLSCYLSLGIPLRTVDVPAILLNSTESRKTQIELWSPAELQFIPVAHVSQRNDFISKRLHITYGKDYSVEGYCSIIESNIVNIPVLLGCILENNVKANSVNFERIFKLFNVQ